LGKSFHAPVSSSCYVLIINQHYFLQRLPNIAHVRSLYIPQINEHPHGANLDVRDLALQIVDIVTLRKDVELCYMGIGAKCFEILEHKPTQYEYGVGESYHTDGTAGAAGYAALVEGDITDDDEADIDDDGDDVVGEEEGVEEDLDDMGLGEDDEDSDDDEFFGDEGIGGKRESRLRLREILFYDDKVSIFKARHGKL
jgi:hypothetical protein